MKEIATSAVPDSLFGELRRLVRVYRGEPALQEGGTSERTGVVVILGTQVLPGGRPSRTLRARTRHAARLYAGGKVTFIIPTGGVGKHPPSEAEVMARILREAGVPETDILLEEEARSTRESARLVAEITKQRGIRSVLLVTDPLHCVRAVATFRVEGILASASPVYSSPMWRSRGLRRRQFLREIGAILWYRMRRRRAERPAG